MTRNFRSLALIVVTASAIAPAAAFAQSDSSSANAAGVTCAKDYSKNSVNGDYCTTGATCVRVKDYSKNSVNGDYCASPVTSSTAAAASATPAVVKDEGFSWSDAGVGAGGTLVLLLLAAAGGSILIVRRRHRLPAVGRTGSPVTD